MIEKCSDSSRECGVNKGMEGEGEEKLLMYEKLELSAQLTSHEGSQKKKDDNSL